MKDIPHDPLKDFRVCIMRNCYTHFSTKADTFLERASLISKEEQEIAALPGEYMYWLQRDKQAAMIIAKAETADLANYVIVDVSFDKRNGFNGAAINA